MGGGQVAAEEVAKEVSLQLMRNPATIEARLLLLLRLYCIILYYIIYNIFILYIHYV